PFPDAHLYDEAQRLDEQPPAAPIPAAPPAISTPRPSSAFDVPGGDRDDQPYSDEHPSGTYRVPAGFAKGVADPTRQYDAPASGPQGYVGAPAYSSDADRDELIAPATTRY